MRLLLVELLLGSRVGRQSNPLLRRSACTTASASASTTASTTTRFIFLNSLKVKASVI